MKSRAELGQELIEIVKTPLNGASGNVTLADRSFALLEQGASLEERDADGMTALMWAARQYRRQIFNAVMDKKPDPLARDNNGMTALDHAKKTKRKLAIPPLEKSIKTAWKETQLPLTAGKAVRAHKPARFTKQGARGR